jgi:TolB-like protein
MQYHFDEFILDTDQFVLSQQGSPIHAEPQVIELIRYLLEHRGRLVSREEINREIWRGRIVSDSALSTRIKLARQALGDDGRRQKYIRTIHKKGFVFNTEVKVASGLENGPGETSVVADISNRPTGRQVKPSLAVTQFVDQTHELGQSIVSQGITEDIVTTLSRISKLVVLTYPMPVGDDANPPDNPRLLEAMAVDYRLEGSVLCEGELLRISVRLIEVASGQHVWAQRYDRKFRSLFELQDDITREVVSALQVELTEGDQALLASRGTANIEAWKMTFEGQAAVLEHRQDSVRRGLQLLERALALDPDYILAWSALATAHWKESLNQGWSPSREASLQQAIEASDRALQLDPLNANTLAVRSLIRVSQRRFDDALECAEQAIYHARSEAHTIAIASISLRALCRPEQAIVHTQKAMQLCPVYPAWYPYGIAICYWMMKQYEQALAAVEEAIRIDPGLSLNHMVLAMIRVETGQVEEARTAIRSLLAIDPDFRFSAFAAGIPFLDENIEARRRNAVLSAGLPE